MILETHLKRIIHRVCDDGEIRRKTRKHIPLKVTKNDSEAISIEKRGNNLKMVVS